MGMMSAEGIVDFALDHALACFQLEGSDGQMMMVQVDISDQMKKHQLKCIALAAAREIGDGDAIEYLEGRWDVQKSPDIDVLNCRVLSPAYAAGMTFNEFAHRYQVNIDHLMHVESLRESMISDFSKGLDAELRDLDLGE